MRSSADAPGSWSRLPRFGANTLEVTRDLEPPPGGARADARAARRDLPRRALLRPASFVESPIARLRDSLLVGAVLVVVLLLLTLRDWRGTLVSFSAVRSRSSRRCRFSPPAGLSSIPWAPTGWWSRSGWSSMMRHRRRRRHAATSPRAPARSCARCCLRPRSRFAGRSLRHCRDGRRVLPIVMLSGLQGHSFARSPPRPCWRRACPVGGDEHDPALCALLMQATLRARSLARCATPRRGSSGGSRPLAPPARSCCSWSVERLLGLALFRCSARACCQTFARLPDRASALRAGSPSPDLTRGRAHRRASRGIAGVKSVAERIGHAENGKDPDAPSKSEFEIQLDPAHGLTTARLERSAPCSMTSPTGSSRFTRRLAERIGETLPGSRALLRRVLVPISMSMIRSPGASPRCCIGESGAVHLKVRRASRARGAVREAQLALFGCTSGCAGRTQCRLPRHPRRAPRSGRPQRAGRSASGDAAGPGGRRRFACARYVTACVRGAAVTTLRIVSSMARLVEREGPAAPPGRSEPARVPRIGPATHGRRGLHRRARSRCRQTSASVTAARPRRRGRTRGLPGIRSQHSS